VTFFQRIKTPFTENPADEQVRLQPRTRLVGELLQERREDLGLDLDEIGAMLRIKPAYLAALEQGRSHDLPGPTYAIGFVRAYADFLGLEAEPVLTRFKAEATGITARPDLALPVPLGERSLPGGALVLVALILALCGYGIWYYLSTEARDRPERVAAVPAALKPAVLVPPPSPSGGGASNGENRPSPSTSPGQLGAAANSSQGTPPAPAAAPTPPSVSTPAVASAAPPGASAPPTATPASQPTTGSTTTLAPGALIGTLPRSTASSQTPASPTASAPAAPPAQPTAAAPAGSAAAPATRVTIRALADCWIQVRAPDQSIVFSRVLKSGEVYAVPARAGLSLRTGNAGALEIAVDGKTAPPIGSVGTLRRDVALDPQQLAAGTAVHG
jgi:cytoskeleton protein RodZ